MAPYTLSKCISKTWSKITGRLFWIQLAHQQFSSHCFFHPVLGTRDLKWQEDIGYLLKVDYYVIWLTQNTPMVVKTGIFVKAKFPKCLCNETAICGYELLDKSDPGLMVCKSKISLGPAPSSTTVSARGAFARGTFPLIQTAPGDSASRIFCGCFTHIYYQAIALVSQRTIFKKSELWKKM